MYDDDDNHDDDDDDDDEDEDDDDHDGDNGDIIAMAVVNSIKSKKTKLNTKPHLKHSGSRSAPSRRRRKNP